MRFLLNPWKENKELRRKNLELHAVSQQLHSEVENLREQQYGVWGKNPRTAFRYAMDELKSIYFDGQPKNTQQRAEQLSELDFLMKCLRIDIFGSSLTELFLAEGARSERAWDIKGFPAPPLPSEFCSEKIECLPFGNNTVVSFPYCKAKWKNAFSDVLREGFHQVNGDYPASCYRGIFYPELQLIIVDSGRHHAAAASVIGGGSVNVTVYALAGCFPYYETDGEDWIDTRTNKRTAVTDARFALLYMIARRKWEIESIQFG